MWALAYTVNGRIGGLTGKRWELLLPGFTLAAVVKGSAEWVAVRLWPFPAVTGASLMFAWGAEVAAFFVSRGFALAILAWLQVMPEFAVEAAIVHQAAVSTLDLADPQHPIHLVTANFTGSNRLLVGLGWPAVYFTAYLVHRLRKRGEKRSFIERRTEKPFEVVLDREHSVEVVFLMLPTAYFAVIYLRGSLNLGDSAVLIAVYALYLWILGRLPPVAREEAKHLHGPPRLVMERSRRFQAGFAASMFLAGGTILFLSVGPFITNMTELAGYFLGVASVYFFIQWVAPILTEAPEGITAFYWAKTVRLAPVALNNLISSKINQWTLLIAMIPFVFAAFSGDPFRPLVFYGQQREEVLLTMAQSLFACAVLMKLRLTGSDAGVLFGLWAIQMALPGTRTYVTFLYFVLVVVELLRRTRVPEPYPALTAFRGLCGEFIAGRGKRPPARPPSPP